MSPQHFAAQHMAAQGRGPDSQLVHMSPREVAGLQALAMAGGGSLSINPNTGLPEAGFLDKMLPMILGVGITAATGGAAAPWMIGLGLGGIEAARTGDLGKGLVAGLGAYGGAGLAGGLMAAGAAGGAGAAGAGAAGAGAAGAGAAGAGAAGAGAAGAGTAANIAQAAPAFDVAGLAASPVELGAAQSAFPFEMFSQGAAPVASPLTPFPYATTPSAAAAPTPSTIGSGFSQMGRGFSALTEPAGREAFMGQAASKGVEATGVGGGQGLLKYGAAAGLPLLLDDTKTKMPEEDRERRDYAFDAGRMEEGAVDPITGQPRYFNPIYRRLAAGGPVEAMSAANVYDMQNARGGVSDMGIDNSTGMQRMADGGLSGLKPLSGYGGETRSSYTYDPTKKLYVTNPVAISDAYNYSYDPTTQQYTRLASPPAPGVAAPSQSFDGSGGGVDGVGMGDGAVGGAGDVGGGGGSHGLGGDGSPGGWADGGLAALAGGGMSHLGDYSDGGRLLKGPGDGVSDSIPAVIGQKRPARLADGEFVVPARIVSELGNGSTEAGARKLYAMMDRVQRARGKTTGKGKVAKNTRADKYLPA